jgi:hypothetical protein
MLQEGPLHMGPFWSKYPLRNICTSFCHKYQDVTCAVEAFTFFRGRYFRYLFVRTLMATMLWFGTDAVIDSWHIVRMITCIWNSSNQMVLMCGETLNHVIMVAHFIYVIDDIIYPLNCLKSSSKVKFSHCLCSISVVFMFVHREA